MAEQCSSCDLFTPAEPGDRNENNCTKWLCNCDSCPYDADIEFMLPKVIESSRAYAEGEIIRI